MYGTPVDLTTMITLIVGAPPGFVGPVAITGDFEGSLDLQSIEALDDGGAAVAFSVSSESGTPYPVPEPAEALLVLAGAVALARIRRG